MKKIKIHLLHRETLHFDHVTYNWQKILKKTSSIAIIIYYKYDLELNYNLNLGF